MINNNNDIKHYNRVISKIDDDNKRLLLTGSVASFSVVDKVFYSIDKMLEKGIKNTIDFFSTTNIYLEDMVEYSTKTPNITALNSVRKDVESYKSKNIKFHSIENIKAPVILGLDVRLSELYEILLSNKNYVVTLEDTMTKFNDVLDDILNSKKDSIVLDIDRDDVSALNKQIEAINKDINKITNKKKLSDRKPVKSLVSNFVELDKLVKDTLVLGNVYTMERLEDIYDINNELVKKLDIIYNSIKKHDVNIEENSYKDFVLFIDTIAKYTTVVAFLFYLYYQLTNMLVGINKVVSISITDEGTIDVIINRISRLSSDIRSFARQLIG